jgi:uncharacterized small protein (DUF1192 family)
LRRPSERKSFGVRLRPTFSTCVGVGRRNQRVPRPRQQRLGEPLGLDLAVSGLDQAVAVLESEIGLLESQLKDKREERRELQQTRTRLTKLRGNSASAAAPRAATGGRRARPGATRSRSAASAAPAAAAPGRRRRRRSAGRAPAAERETAIIQALTGKPMTAVETARAVGLSTPRARQIIKELRDSGRLRVEEVSSGRGRPRLVYHAGPDGSSSGAGTGEAATAATAASLSASSSSGTRPRSGGRRGTSDRKR